jgi:hypothetical protein
MQMVGIKGVGGVPEPKPERPATVRGRKNDGVAKDEKVQDDVLISSEAQAAASVARIIKEGVSGDIRADRVQVARERLERGDYKNPEVVREVAKRVSKYLP